MFEPYRTYIVEPFSSFFFAFFVDKRKTKA